MGIEPTLPAWKAGTLPLSYTRILFRSPCRTYRNLQVPERQGGQILNADRLRDTRIASRSVPCLSRATWVEQDSNLRRQCHQIYSLAPLAAWVSTRVFDDVLLLSVSPRVGWSAGCSGPSRLTPCCSRGGRAGGETRTHNPRFTKPKLCRLSYASAGVVSIVYVAAGSRPGRNQLGREIFHYINLSAQCKAFPTFKQKEHLCL
jgi:hypothetical protein